MKYLKMSKIWSKISKILHSSFRVDFLGRWTNRKSTQLGLDLFSKVFMNTSIQELIVVLPLSCPILPIMSALELVLEWVTLGINSGWAGRKFLDNIFTIFIPPKSRSKNGFRVLINGLSTTNIQTIIFVLDDFPWRWTTSLRIVASDDV